MIELDALMVNVYAEMRRRGQWINTAAKAMGLPPMTLNRLLKGVTVTPTERIIRKLASYAHGGRP